MRQLVLVALAFSLCACGPRAQPGVKKPRASLYITCTAPDATLVIDDTPIGEVREFRRGIGLSPGPHRIMLRHDRYHTRYIELTLTDGEQRKLDVSMVEILD